MPEPNAQNPATFSAWTFAGILTITYGVLWLVHEYTAFFLTLLVPIISFCTLIISLITEYLERSNIPRWYYRFMAILIILPLLVGILMACILKFEFGK